MNLQRNKQILNALKAAIPYTIPILASFLFLGFTYGFYMSQFGFSFLYPLFMSMFIYAGSVEFLTVQFLLGTFDPLKAFLLAFMVNARHLFYGISLLDQFKKLDHKKYYLIYGLCDETFSIHVSAKIPSKVDESWFLFFVTLLNQIYWVLGASLGGLFGNMVQINLKGLDFVLTALFVVIFLEQILTHKKYIVSGLGILLPTLCLFIFGKNNFMIYAMLSIVIALFLLKTILQKENSNV